MQTITRVSIVVTVLGCAASARADEGEGDAAAGQPARLAVGLQTEGTRTADGSAHLGVGVTARYQFGPNALAVSLMRLFDEGSSLETGWQAGARAYRTIAPGLALFGGAAYERWRLDGAPAQAEAVTAQAGVSGRIALTRSVSLFGEMGVARRWWIDDGGHPMLSDGPGLELKSVFGIEIAPD